jgi:hypothetical protein
MSCNRNSALSETVSYAKHCRGAARCAIDRDQRLFTSLDFLFAWSAICLRGARFFADFLGFSILQIELHELTSSILIVHMFAVVLAYCLFSLLLLFRNLVMLLLFAQWRRVAADFINAGQVFYYLIDDRSIKDDNRLS